MLKTKNLLFQRLKPLLFVAFFSLPLHTIASDSLRVLFIGNSMTYFNDMPSMFREIAENRGKMVFTEQYTPGGTGFVNHVDDPAVYALLRESWDVVVLQPGTAESAGVSYPVSVTVSRGKTMLDSLYAYSPCAKAFLYEIPYGVPSETEYSTYFQVQKMIKDSVSKMADGMNVQMIPAGESARRYYSMHQNLLLHGSFNDVHPNASGSFLVASTCYVTIYQEPVSDCAFYSSVQADTAQKFFSIVDTVVLNRMTEWNMNTYNLHADFTSSVNGNDVTFDNNSANFTSVSWHFGDQSTSNELNPAHTYVNPGEYEVKLYAYSGTCIDSSTVSLLINTTGIQELSNNHLLIYPNPTNDLLNIPAEIDFVSYSITDLKGKELLNGQEAKIIQINVESLNAGSYLVYLKTSDSKMYNCTFQKI